jgi:hypothetical protein
LFWVAWKSAYWPFGLSFEGISERGVLMAVIVINVLRNASNLDWDTKVGCSTARKHLVYASGDNHPHLK